MPPSHAKAHAPPAGAPQGPLGAGAVKVGLGAPGSLPERLLASPPGSLGAAAPLQAGAPAAAALRAPASTAAGAPGWSPICARTWSGHPACIMPPQGAATCTARAATGRGFEWCHSLGHEGHRQAHGTATCRSQGVACVASSAQQVQRHVPLQRTVLGSQGRESPRASSEDDWTQARQHVLLPEVLGRRQWPPRVGSFSDDNELPRWRPPCRAGSYFFRSSWESIPHHQLLYGGLRGGR